MNRNQIIERLMDLKPVVMNLGFDWPDESEASVSTELLEEFLDEVETFLEQEI